MTRAIAAGAVATGVEIALTYGERRLLGPAPYEPSRMVQRWAALLGHSIGRRKAELLGTGMRLVYGPAWGIPAKIVARRMPWPMATLAVGSIVVGFELVALPLTRATPEIRSWPQRFVVANCLHSLAFAAVATRLADVQRGDRHAAL